jgi:hypothetical protein
MQIENENENTMNKLALDTLKALVKAYLTLLEMVCDSAVKTPTRKCAYRAMLRLQVTIESHAYDWFKVHTWDQPIGPQTIESLRDAVFETIIDDSWASADYAYVQMRTDEAFCEFWAVQNDMERPFRDSHPAGYYLLIGPHN